MSLAPSVRYTNLFAFVEKLLFALGNCGRSNFTRCAYSNASLFISVVRIVELTERSVGIRVEPPLS